MQGTHGMFQTNRQRPQAGTTARGEGTGKDRALAPLRNRISWKNEAPLTQRTLRLRARNRTSPVPARHTPHRLELMPFGGEGLSPQPTNMIVTPTVAVVTNAFRR